MTVAIDFGTSNTVIARWNPVSQAPDVVHLAGLSESQTSGLIPSLVYVDNAATQAVKVGQQVIQNAGFQSDSQRFFRQFKRGIGAEIQGFLPVLDGQTITLTTVGAWFIRGVYDALLKQYPDAQKSLTLTVPVDSFEAYRQWLSQVFADLEVEQIQLLDEPTAAALGYGRETAKTLLVVDFGGGTLDLVLLRQAQTRQVKPGIRLKWGAQWLGQSDNSPTEARPKVIAKAGRTLGGSDIDAWIGAHFQAKLGIPITPWTLRLMERLKEQLSRQTQAEEVYLNPEQNQEVPLSLSRSELETILKDHDFFDRLDGALNQVLNQARTQGLSPADIDAVILIGGTCQIPAIQAWINNHFPQDKIAADQPLTAVATGALALNPHSQIEDFLYHSYGIRYWDYRLQKHNWHPIIPVGQTYPMARPVELILGASVPDQPGLELIMGELGQALEKTEIFFENGQLITKILRDEATVQALNDHPDARTLAQFNPPGQPGQDRFKVLFWVNEQRQLRVSIDDLLTQTRIVEDQLVVVLR